MVKNYKKVGIIYDGTKEVDWAISSFRKDFRKRGVSTILFDANSIDSISPAESIETSSIPEVEKCVEEGYTVWMNRVYPSESSKQTIHKSLNLVSWLGSRNYVTINPLTACAADYDKDFAYKMMKKYEIPTPKTELITGDTKLETILEEFALPLILKKNTGGKGMNVTKINNLEKLKAILQKKEILSGKYLIQEFAKPIVDFDVRIGVIDGNPLISYARTLVDKGDSGELWMGSCHHGSRIIEYKPSEEEKRLAVLASNAIGAKLNEVDIQITKNGPVIIENNPTPGYDEGEERWIELITTYIFDNHLQNGN